MEYVVVSMMIFALLILAVLCLRPVVAKRNTEPEVRRVWTATNDIQVFAVRGVSTPDEARELVGGEGEVELLPTLDGITTWLVRIKK